MKRFLANGVLLLSLLSLALWAHAREIPIPKRIVILGDSLTEGYGVEKSAAFPTLVEAELRKSGFDIKIINAGISGSTTASAPSRLKWILKDKPDIVFLALGSNDGLRGVAPAVTKKNLEEAILLAKDSKVTIWLAGFQLPPNYGGPTTSQFRQLFIDLAKKHNLPLLPFLLEGVAAKPNLNQPDQIHPNEEGHALIAKNVSQFFKRNLK